MTEFEKQVAEALQQQLDPCPVEMFDERSLDEWGIEPLAKLLAPRVAAAIDVVIDDLAKCDEANAAEMGGDLNPDLRGDARLMALAALRGEP